MKVIENIYEFRFIIELFVLCILFTNSFQRRRHLTLRVVFLLFVCFMLSGLFFYMQDTYWTFNIMLTITRYIVLFFAVMAGIMFCYKVSMLTSIFCVTGVYAVQHLIYNFNVIIFEGFGIKSYMLENSTNYLYYVMLYFLLASLLYAFIYFIFIKKFKRQDEKYFQNKIIIMLCIFVNLYATVFSIIFRISQDNAQFEIFLIGVLLDIMCCLFTMYVLFYVFRTSILQDELNVIQSLLKKEKAQFAISQANIQLINIKCHDLKHQLKHLSNRLDKTEVEELQKAISIYDIPMTGNPVLDVVIAEKKLQCEREEIEFTCMVDGEKLGFMREADIYSLFGNALDNAINSVREINGTDKRVVSLIIKDTMGLISIHIENYFQGELIFEDGLPVTTNKDKDYHGFGMKSIKYLIEKYGGELSIKLDEDIFNLNIVFQSQ